MGKSAWKCKHESHPDPNDKNAFMAWMRSNIKANLGRKPDLSGEEFENPVDEAVKNKGMRRLKKWSNEHIKCVTVVVKETYPYTEKPRIYIVGFLADDNRFSFETLRDNPVPNGKMTNPGLYRLEKVVELFKNKNIDSDTIFVVCTEDYNERDFFPLALNFISRLTNCMFYRLGIPEVLYSLDREFGIYSGMKDRVRTLKHFKSILNRVLFRRLNEAYSFIAESGFCPWMTGDEVLRNKRLARRARHGIMVAELAMLVGMVKRYHNIEKRLREKTI